MSEGQVIESPQPITPVTAPPVPEGPEKENGSVPYDRFKQVIDQKNSATQLAQAAQQQAQAYQQEVLAWRQWAAQRQPEKQTGNQPQQEGDPVLRALRADLGGDEAADKAIEVMEQYSDYAAKKKGFVRAEDVQGMINQALARSEGKTTSAFAVSNRFQQWVNNGMISVQDAQGLQQGLGQYLQQYPQVAEDPNALNHVVSHMAMTAMEQGKIKPFQASPRAENPLSRVSGNGQHDQPMSPPAFDAGALPFSRLKKLTPERIRQLTDHSQRNHQGATS